MIKNAASINHYPEKRWNLLYTKARQEQIAEKNLVSQGFDVYLPVIGLRRNIDGRFRYLVEPLFARYLFIDLGNNHKAAKAASINAAKPTLDKYWETLCSIYGVSSPVYFGSSIVTVSAQFILQLRSMEHDNGIILPFSAKTTKLTEDLKSVFAAESAVERSDLLIKYLKCQSNLKSRQEAQKLNIKQAI